jgi:hypothetical protein
MCRINSRLGGSRGAKSTEDQASRVDRNWLKEHDCFYQNLSTPEKKKLASSIAFSMLSDP